ncbi:hypothetical protein T07_14338 [Trichinella nelsoni]|uniref:Uncharacterized protein n=1 Tax=Trichinella nelsoni TaxID=6336 RepID=A0A0V0SKU1_9BILA|nr:hypothetical protein T07_14338 [Trichinella nelsoni]
MNLLPTFLVFFLANLRCEFALKYRYPYFKFELADEYMDLFRYSNLITQGEAVTIICGDILEWKPCKYDFETTYFPCNDDVCKVRGNDTYCEFKPIGGRYFGCYSLGFGIVVKFPYFLAAESSVSCASCNATNSNKLLFTYIHYHHWSKPQLASCNTLMECSRPYHYEDVPSVRYYVDGHFYWTSHCNILTKDIDKIPSVLIFSYADIPRAIPFEIYLVDELNEKKRLLRYFEFVELPVGGTLYFEINSVELVTCYLYTDDSFIGFFAVSVLNPTISLDEIRHNYGICEFEMLCEGRLNALHSSIVAFTRQTFVILESPVIWEYASSKPHRRYWKLLSLLKCDDVLFQVLRWDTQNIVVTLQIWDLTEGRMLSNDTLGNRVTFRRGNNQYALKVKATYDRCNPRVVMERDFEVRFTFKKCPGDISIVSDDYRLERVHN